LDERNASEFNTLHAGKAPRLPLATQNDYSVSAGGPAPGGMSTATPCSGADTVARGAAAERETRYLLGMSALKARVENGRIKLDEPTDLPEGQIIELIPLEEVISTDGDDLDDEERAALHRELEASIAEAEAGELVDFDVALAELRSPS
jgi:hypothetical protein